ncbi:MAG: TolC family protein [Gemmatimonadaceae bacterium]|nr:TolC family protein [Gemmatimonadaceae bacterium]
MPSRGTRRLALLVTFVSLGVPRRSAEAQTVRPVTRADAIASARGAGARLRIARADSSAAGATLAIARQFENPLLGGQYTGSAPREHYTLDVPVDLPWIRRARVGVAQAALVAADQRFQFEREAVAYDVDTMYTRAQVAIARQALSAQSARDADSLLTLARLRRDAGDASEFDVQLATVVAGQLAGAASADSLDATSLLLTLQSLMGLTAAEVTIALTDTLAPSPAALTPESGTPLLMRAAQEDLRAAQLAVTFQQRSVISGTSLSVGYETRDPNGTGSSLLPSFGLALPLPLFNRNRAAVALAESQRRRAEASLRLAESELAAAVARATRALAVATARVARSRQLQGNAERVAALSLLAYQEGAATLPAVLEAQRAAREARAQYLDDVAAAQIAAGLVHLLTFSEPARP